MMSEEHKHSSQRLDSNDENDDNDSTIGDNNSVDSADSSRIMFSELIADLMNLNDKYTAAGIALENSGENSDENSTIETLQNEHNRIKKEMCDKISKLQKHMKCSTLNDKLALAGSAAAGVLTGATIAATAAAMLNKKTKYLKYKAKYIALKNYLHT